MAACQSFNHSENGTCTLFSDPLKGARSKYQFKKNRCESADRKILEGDSFVIRSGETNLYLNESPLKSGWKKRRATHWQFVSSKHRIRLNGSNRCLVHRTIYKFDDLAEVVGFRECSHPNASASFFQSFVMLFDRNVCRWTLKTIRGRHVMILKNITTEELPVTKEVKIVKPIVSNPAPLSAYFAPRNVSSFEANIEEDHICARFDILNGSLLPTQFEAPIFFAGQVLTIACNEKYILKREKKDRVTWTCGEKQQKYKCISASTPYFACIFIIAVAALAIGVLAHVTVRRVRCCKCSYVEKCVVPEGRRVDEITQMQSAEPLSPVKT